MIKIKCTIKCFCFYRLEVMTLRKTRLSLHPSRVFNAKAALRNDTIRSTRLLLTLTAITTNNCPGFPSCDHDYSASCQKLYRLCPRTSMMLTSKINGPGLGEETISCHTLTTIGGSLFLSL